jgi:hypothetical protein
MTMAKQKEIHMQKRYELELFNNNLKWFFLHLAMFLMCIFFLLMYLKW